MLRGVLLLVVVIVALVALLRRVLNAGTPATPPQFGSSVTPQLARTWVPETPAPLDLPPITLTDPTPTPAIDLAEPVETTLTPAVSGYCARCKMRQSLRDTTPERTASGRSAIRGTCSVCGAAVFTFVPKG